MKKKILAMALVAIMLMALTACSSATSGNPSDNIAAGTGNPEKTSEITVNALDGNKEPIQVTVPYDPQRIVVLDLASLDVLDCLGLGDRIVGTPTTTLDYLQSYIQNDDIANLGSVKTPDLEEVIACDPDIIFMGGRMADYYDDLTEIAPVVRLATDNADPGLVESVRANAKTIASIFGKEDEIDALLAQYDSRIQALKTFAEGKTAVLGMCTSGGFNVLGNDGRCSIIVDEIGFNNIGNDAAANTSSSGHGSHGDSSEDNDSSEHSHDSESDDSSGHSHSSESDDSSGHSHSSESDDSSGHSHSSESGDSSGHNHGSENNDSSESSGITATHGNEASFELIVALDPDYIFVMDRDAAISSAGAQLAQEIMENDLIMSMDAYKNGNLVILEHPAIWYTAEGGISALGIMLDDLESALLNE